MPKGRLLLIIPAILILTVSVIPTNDRNNAGASTDSEVSQEDLIRNCQNGNAFACAALEGGCPQIEMEGPNECIRVNPSSP